MRVGDREREIARQSVCDRERVTERHIVIQRYTQRHTRHTETDTQRYGKTERQRERKERERD